MQVKEVVSKDALMYPRRGLQRFSQRHAKSNLTNHNTLWA